MEFTKVLKKPTELKLERKQPFLVTTRILVVFFFITVEDN